MWDIAIGILVLAAAAVAVTITAAYRAPAPSSPRSVPVVPLEHVGADEEYVELLHEWNTDEHPMLEFDPEPEPEPVVEPEPEVEAEPVLVPDATTAELWRDVMVAVWLKLDEPIKPVEPLLFDEDEYRRICDEYELAVGGVR